MRFLNSVTVSGTGSFTGQVTIPATPVATTDAASKAYVDSKAGSGLSGSGTVNYAARWTGAAALGTGVLLDDGSLAAVGEINVSAAFNVKKTHSTAAAYNINSDVTYTDGSGTASKYNVRSLTTLQTTAAVPFSYFGFFDQLITTGAAVLTDYRSFWSGGTLNAATSITARRAFAASAVSNDSTVIVTSIGFTCANLGSVTSTIAYEGSVNVDVAKPSRWNLSMSGTAQNYLRGNLGIGANRSAPSAELDVNGSVLVSGATTTNTLAVASSATVGGSFTAGSIHVSSTDPRYILTETDGPADAKRSDFLMAAGTLYGRFYNDATSANANWLTVTRSGQTVGTITLGAPTTIEGALTATQLTASAGTGTAPLVVSSTTLVTNLNADQLDGQHGAYYLAWGNMTGVPANIITGTGTSPYLPLWTGAGTLGNSLIQDNGANIILGRTTLIPTGAVTCGNTGTTGTVGFNPGTATQPGYINFYTPFNVEGSDSTHTRRGYIGYRSGASQLVIAAENGWTWRVAQSFTCGSTLTVESALAVSPSSTTTQSMLRVGPMFNGTTVSWINQALRLNGVLYLHDKDDTADPSAQFYVYAVKAEGLKIERGSGSPLAKVNLPGLALDVGGVLSRVGDIQTRLNYSVAPSTNVLLTLPTGGTTLSAGHFYRFTLCISSTGAYSTGAVYLVHQTAAAVWVAVQVSQSADAIKASLVLVGDSVYVNQNSGSTTYNVSAVSEAKNSGNATLLGPSYGGLEGALSSLGGNVTAAGTLTGSRFISTVVTGTAPLGITSTTLVTNLNADLLDGNHGAYYLDWANFTGVPSNIITGTGVTNRLPRWTSGGGLQDSGVTDDGTTIICTRPLNITATGSSILKVGPSFIGAGTAISWINQSTRINGDLYVHHSADPGNAAFKFAVVQSTGLDLAPSAGAASRIVLNATDVEAVGNFKVPYLHCSGRMSVGQDVAQTAGSGSGITGVPSRRLNVWLSGDLSSYNFIPALVTGLDVNEAANSILGPFSNNCLVNWKLRGGLVSVTPGTGVTSANTDSCFQPAFTGTSGKIRGRSFTTIGNGNAAAQPLTYEFTDTDGVLTAHITNQNRYTPFIQFSNISAGDITNIRVEYSLDLSVWTVLFDAPPTFAGLFFWRGPSSVSASPAVKGIRFILTLRAGLASGRIMELGWSATFNIQGANLYGLLNAPNPWGQPQTMPDVLLTNLISQPLLATDATGKIVGTTAAAIGAITGTGTLDRVPRWTSTGALADSTFYETSTASAVNKPLWVNVTGAAASMNINAAANQIALLNLGRVNVMSWALYCASGADANTPFSLRFNGNPVWTASTGRIVDFAFAPTVAGVPMGGGTVIGSGVQDFLPRWSATSGTLVDSAFKDDSTSSSVARQMFWLAGISTQNTELNVNSYASRAGMIHLARGGTPYWTLLHDLAAAKESTLRLKRGGFSGVDVFSVGTADNPPVVDFKATPTVGGIPIGSGEGVIVYRDFATGTLPSLATDKIGEVDFNLPLAGGTLQAEDTVIVSYYPAGGGSIELGGVVCIFAKVDGAGNGIISSMWNTGAGSVGGGGVTIRAMITVIRSLS